MKRIFTLLFTLILFMHAHGQQQYKVAIIAFYNLENLYDTIDNPMVSDDEFTPNGDKNYNGKIYRDKLEHLATVLSQKYRVRYQHGNYNTPISVPFVFLGRELPSLKNPRVSRLG